MPKVINRNFSTYFDMVTNTQFERMLDRQAGVYIAVADVAPKVAKSFDGRYGFEVLTPEQYTAMTTTPEPEDPEEPETGNPVTDAAAAQAAADAAANGGQGATPPTPPGPPKPPASS